MSMRIEYGSICCQTAALLIVAAMVACRPYAGMSAADGVNLRWQEETFRRNEQEHVIQGRVLDQDSRHPLVGAHVVIVGSDPLIGTATDAEGWFVLEHVPLGRHDLRVSYLGYATRVVPNVLVTSGRAVTLEITLKEEALSGDEVVVTAGTRKDQPLNDMAMVSARAFSVEETRRYAGGLDDPARMASAFAGVTATTDVGTNAIVIRGNAPKGVVWRLEGVEIPNPTHFAGQTVAGGGGLTLFSSQLLTDSDFLTGAFPAEYGNAVAGVFDMRFRSGNPSRREHALGVGVLGVEGASEGPFVDGGASTYLVNYRYSTIGLLLPLLPTEDVATYQDLAFKLRFPTRRAGRFEVWGLGGLDGQTMSATRDSAEWEYEVWDRTRSTLRLGVGAAGLTHTLVLNRNSYLETTLAATLHHTDWEADRLDDRLVLRENRSVRSTQGRVIVQSFMNRKFAAHHVNRTGVNVQRLLYDLNLQAAPDDVPPLVTISSGRGSSTLLRVFSQSSLTLSGRVSANVGFHLQHLALTGDTSIEPRVGLRWQVTGGQALSAGYGLHSQIEPLRFYLVRHPETEGATWPNRDLAMAKAHHSVLAYDRRLGEDARLKLEAYHQYHFDVPVIADSSFSLFNFMQDWDFDEALVNDGAGWNYGIEGTLERFFAGGYYGLLTGTLYGSRYRGGDGVWRRSRFDQRYAGNALAGYERTVGGDDLLGLNVRVALTGGRWRTPVDAAASRAQEDVVLDGSRAFEEQEPGLYVVDATISYRRNHRRYSGVWALQVKNVFAAKDVVRDYNYRTGQVEEIKEGYPLPVLSYKIEF